MNNSLSAAIFDLDGTLIPHTSAEKTFFFYLLKTGNLSFVNIFQMLSAIWTARGNFHDIARTNKRYLKKKSVTKLKKVARDYFEPQITNLVFTEMHEIIEIHRNRNDLLLLLTGTLDIIAECFVRNLKFDGFRAGSLQIKNDQYTGKIDGILPYGFGKLEVLRELKDKFGFDRDKTTLYANIFADRYVMNAIEKPVAVNPDSKLFTYAKKSGWKIFNTG
jgi:HAD superfamily phosphoserine phosphatase-like hydrolase